MSDFFINLGLYVTYIMIGVAVLLAILFPLLFLIQNPKKAKNSFYGVLALAVVFVVSYFLASNVPYENLSPTATRLVGGGLIMLYIVLAATVLIAIYSEIARIFK